MVIEIAGVEIPHDTAIFSGLVNNTLETSGLIGKMAKVGIIFYKTIFDEPREGWDIPSMIQIEKDGTVITKNAIGLTGTGIDYLVKGLYEKPWESRVKKLDKRIVKLDENRVKICYYPVFINNVFLSTNFDTSTKKFIHS